MKTATRITRRECLALPGMAALAQDPAARLTVDDEIRQMAEQPPLSMKFKGGNAEACRAWQRAFAVKLGELLGPCQPPQEWKTTTERVVDLADHRRHEFVLRAEGHRDLPVYLLTPREMAAGKHPGVLALHGHGEFGYDSVAGIATTPARQKDIAELHYDYGVQLVRRGYVVAAPCFTPFGRRVKAARTKGIDACGSTFIRLLLFGKILMAENLRDALWSIELLTRQENVDPARIGCVGLSYGGRMTMLTSALSPKIRVAVISGALNVMQERVRGGGPCGAQLIPGLVKYGDVPEIASLIAPRPCLWEVGRDDDLMVKEWIEPALERMRPAWKAFNALDRLDVDYFEGRHQWNGVKAYPLLAKVLRP